MNTRIGFALLLLALLVAPLAAQAQPVVYAVLLYSPTCPHCHDVIDNHLPPIQARFGDQLRVLLVDVTTQGGNALALSAYEFYRIPRNNWVVPMMIVDNRILIGSAQIPAELPGIVEAGLASGGLPLPDLPGLQNAEALFETDETAAVTAAESPAARTLADRLAADPVANGLALLVLAALLISLVAVLALRSLTASLVRQVSLIALIGAAGLALSLIFQSSGDTVPVVLAIASLLLLLASMYVLWTRGSEALIPLVSVVGLGVAGYLAYVELTHTAAACGLVGNCNAVQQSEYAQLLGVPVGVIGLAGYVVILLVWGLYRLNSSFAARMALFGLALIGAAFSLYLTFLEPFVIGAVCAWCLLSAVLMVALLWLTTPLSAPAPQPAHAEPPVPARQP
jgi:uncharacterized membrane protein